MVQVFREVKFKERQAMGSERLLVSTIVSCRPWLGAKAKIEVVCLSPRREALKRRDRAFEYSGLINDNIQSMIGLYCGRVLSLERGRGFSSRGRLVRQIDGEGGIARNDLHVPQ